MGQPASISYDEVNGLEKLTYEEARDWFWTRTVIWTLLAAVVSMAAYFFYSGDIDGIRTLSSRIWVSVGCGLLVTLLGLMAAYISIQFTWVRRGWRRGFVLNAPACAVIAGLTALILCGITLSFMQNSPPNPFTEKAAFKAYTDTVDAAYQLMQLGIGAAAFWGFIFGSWFSLRRDKYFVEQI